MILGTCSWLLLPLKWGWSGGRQRKRYFKDESLEKDKAVPMNKSRSPGEMKEMSSRTWVDSEPEDSLLLDAFTLGIDTPSWGSDPFIIT